MKKKRGATWSVTPRGWSLLCMKQCHLSSSASSCFIYFKFMTRLGGCQRVKGSFSASLSKLHKRICEFFLTEFAGLFDLMASLFGGVCGGIKRDQTERQRLNIDTVTPGY